MEWLELCDLFFSYPATFGIVVFFVFSLFVIRQDDLSVTCISVSAGRRLVEEKPFMTSFDCTLPQCTN